MELTMRRAIVPRPFLFVVLAALLAAAVATTILIAGAVRRPAPPFGPAGNGAIVMDLDSTLWITDGSGANPRALEVGRGRASSPAFSPDGTHLAFQSRADNGLSSIFVTRADGADAVNVTGTMSIITGEAQTRIGWAPDGSWLVFESTDSGLWRLFIVNMDGSGLRQLPASDADQKSPTVSPDGTWIAYQERSADAAARSSLVITRPDGTETRNLISVDVSDGSFYRAQWSPDSSRLVYFRTEGDVHVAATVDLNGRETIVSGPDDDVFNPVWSPDGNHLAYGGGAEGGAVVVDLTTSSRQAIPAGVSGCDVFWSPDGSELLGLAPDCTSLYRIPLDDPDAATRIAVPSGTINVATWQRVAP
jgi:Tol biopolymer transport system component